MLEIKNLDKAYGSKKVLDQVSLSLNTEEITCLIGLNGSGKTTLMKAIMQLTPYQSGEILLDGQTMTKNDFYRVSFIPDALAVQKSMTVQEALDFMADFYPNYQPERAEKIMTFFRLNPDDKISRLSKGNQAKVNLLMGLCVDNDYVLMDEPFSGIDLFTREEIAKLFVSDLIEGRGVLISTHEIDDIEFLVDRAVLINEGRVVKDFYTEDERIETGRSIKDVMREVYLP